MTPAIIILVAVVLASLAIFALSVDDWRRDFTQNHAQTAADARRLELRPISTSIIPAEVAQVVQSAASNLQGWRVAASEESQDGAMTVRLVRATRFWRFEDDVTVKISPAEGGSVVTAQSQSRVGKGDLGQNPRNLIELLGEVRRQLVCCQSPPIC